MRRTAGGRDIHGLPHPVPSEVYDQVSRETARPLLALLLWRDATKNDLSLPGHRPSRRPRVLRSLLARPRRLPTYF